MTEEGGVQRIETAAEQTSDEIKLAGFVRSNVEEIRASASRIAHEGVWMTNIAYLLGMDGVSFNSTLRQFQPINRTSSYLKKNRIHVNKILPTIQNRLARLCKSPPKYDVIPDENTSDHKDAARKSLRVLTSYWDKLELNTKRLWLYMWVQQAGHAYIKICWDPSLGNPMQNPETGELEYEGDVRADIVSPFEIFPDPTAQTFEDARKSFLTHAKVRRLDYFRQQYPERGHLVKAEDAWLQSLQYEGRINAMNTRGPSSSGIQQQMKNSAIELIRYEARSKDYPNGRMIIVANGVLLANKPLPCGEIPLEKFDDVIIGGKYYSESTITHLRPVQDQFNTVIRKRAEWTKKMLNGKIHSFRGNGLTQESLNDQSAEVVWTTVLPNAPDGGKPTPIPVPNIPQWAYTEEQALDKMFNDISGISEVSRGTLPSASIPAIGMQLLTEQDDTRIGIMTEQHERAWARVGSLILKYFEKYRVVPTKLKMAQKNSEYLIESIKGEDLLGNTDVIVVRGSTLPGSKTLKRQEILNVYSQGLLGDPNDPKVRENVLGMLEFGDVSEVWLKHALNSSQIKRGIALMEQGEIPPVHELDNHTMWVDELNNYRLGEKWEALSPEIKALFEDVINQHLEWQMQLAGAPPPPPEPDALAPPPMESLDLGAYIK